MSHSLSVLRAAALLIAACGTPLGAQVTGRVVDDVAGAPVPAALIVLSDEHGREISRTVAGDAGGFLLRPPTRGTYLLGVHALGYESLVGVELRVGATAPELEVRLTQQPIALDPVTATTERRRRRLTAVGFYRRQQMGIGRFLTGEEIQQRSLDRLTDALRIEPSIQVRPIIRDGSNTFRLVFRGAFSQDGCEPTLVLDGVKLGGNILLDEVANPANVLGMELYPRGQGVPVRWGGYDAGCGVILIWTRRHTP